MGTYLSVSAREAVSGKALTLKVPHRPYYWYFLSSGYFNVKINTAVKVEPKVRLVNGINGAGAGSGFLLVRGFRGSGRGSLVHENSHIL